MSRRRRKKQIRIAAQGIVVGVAAALVIILGVLISVRWIVERHVSHRAPFGLAVCAAIFVFMVYRFALAEPKPRQHRRSVVPSTVVELPKDEKAKSA